MTVCAFRMVEAGKRLNAAIRIAGRLTASNSKKPGNLCGLQGFRAFFGNKKSPQVYMNTVW